jgi:hypothetical protein
MIKRFIVEIEADNREIFINKSSIFSQIANLDGISTMTVAELKLPNTDKDASEYVCNTCKADNFNTVLEVVGHYFKHILGKV